MSEILFSHTIEEVDSQISSYKNQNKIPFGYSKEEYNNIKIEFNKFFYEKYNIDLSNKFIYATGHQCEIFHPGILFKDILLNKLVKKDNAIPIHFIVDTDKFEFIYPYPDVTNNSLTLNSFEYTQENIFISEKYDGQKYIQYENIIKNQLSIINKLFDEDQIQSISGYLNYILNFLKEKEKFHIISQKILEQFLKDNQINIFFIKLSEIIHLKGFKSFIQKISERNHEFINIHNEVLNEYRSEHKIKNHAQPIPNLQENELPFWELNFETGNREHAKFPIKDIIYSPRAITNTMFIRLFIADLFIHGRGGGRYEQISDKIINKFFRINASPYFIASATLQLKNQYYFPVNTITLNELNMKMRDINFSPEKFLDSGHFLYKQKMNLLKLFQNKDSNKKELNEKIKIVNLEIIQEIAGIKTEIEELNKNFLIYEKNKETLQNRTYPFFYYDLKDLLIFNPSKNN